jgi:hypothetical protein
MCSESKQSSLVRGAREESCNAPGAKPDTNELAVLAAKSEATGPRGNRSIPPVDRLRRYLAVQATALAEQNYERTSRSDDSPLSGELAVTWATSGLTLRASLSAIVLVAACGGRDAGSGTDAWQFKVDTTRSETDGSVHETSSLRTIGKEGPEGAAGAVAVILSFDCLGDKAISTIMTDQALRQGSVQTRLTVDADSPRRIPGFAGTTPSGGQVVLTIPQDSMLVLLSGHQRARIEYADGAGSYKTTAEFPVAGLEKYRGPFLAACAKIGAR